MGPLGDRLSKQRTPSTSSEQFFRASEHSRFVSSRSKQSAHSVQRAASKASELPWPTSLPS
uniref:Uncharacterized protein n=1 Tax=Leersia perrieri TaxID=77586 RepID=A0A0D9WA50_9ORYZ